MRISLLLLITGIFLVGCSQNKIAGQQTDPASSEPASGNTRNLLTKPGNEFSIAFYNVENLFDTRDNPDKIDEEFLPGSELDWTDEKQQQKTANLAKVIETLGDEDGPEILGLAEVENADVIRTLLQTGSLKERNYAVVHEESPDMRGIDVALVYDKEKFRYLDHRAIRVDFPLEPDYTSRDLLYVRGILPNGDTLHLVVNHWPSRRGGQAESEYRRLRPARMIRELADSLFASNPNSLLILMGDFNDDPTDNSIRKMLLAQANPPAPGSTDLYNPMAELHQPDSQGTLTYKGKWNLFDQFIISPGLLSRGGKTHYVEGSAAIFHPEWMQVGYGSCSDCPKRSVFRGAFVDNGFSDHFPVYIRLSLSDE
jgi:endonuclease/exonuclease/phosphatase family metal-dependent hydrolase